MPQSSPHFNIWKFALKIPSMSTSTPTEPDGHQSAEAAPADGGELAAARRQQGNEYSNVCLLQSYMQHLPKITN